MASHKILVIDDSRVIQKTVKGMLPQGNFEVVEAKDGEEGLNKIHQDRPSLIMLDFLLPKKSGWEVFQEIEKMANAEGKMIPLVLMSGRKEEVTEKLSEPFGFFEFIEKPFEKKTLITAIQSAMKKAKNWKPSGAAPGKPKAAEKAAAPAAGGGSAEDIQALQQKVAKMQSEIDALKKQLGQVVTLIKKKLK